MLALAALPWVAACGDSSAALPAGYQDSNGAQAATATAQIADAPTPDAEVSDEAKGQAMDLLGAAGAERDAGHLEAAADLAKQALDTWPEYADAQAFARDMRAQATAVQATAEAQSRAQASAAATAEALAPIRLSGHGQTATQPITPKAPLSWVLFTHKGRRNFAVKAFQGEREKLLVNTIGSYAGVRPLAGTSPVMFDIQADGDWTIELRPLPGGGEAPFSGEGDDVSATFTPPPAGPWAFAHTGKRDFAVIAHCASGDTLVQNEIGPVNGSRVVRFGRGPCFWEVQADGQ